MAPDTPKPNSAVLHHGLPLPALQRARMHAELAGMDALPAARAVTHAQRRCTGRSDDQVQFWHALYVELAPLARAAITADPIANALSALSLESRTAILLRLGEALPPSAIAQVLDEPETRAAAHLAHAVIELRQRIADGRADSDWLRVLTHWLHAHEPAAARLQRAPAKAVVALPPAWVAEPRERRSSPRRLGLWLALAAVLAAIGIARLVADDWLALNTSPAQESARVIDPAALLLALPDSELAIIDSELHLALLPRLDFYIWLMQRDEVSPQRAEDDSSRPANMPAIRTPNSRRLTGSLDRAASWRQLTPAERAALLDRYAIWQAQSAAEHAALRLNLPHWMGLDTATQLIILRQQSAYSALDAAARRALDDQFEALSPPQRRALLPAIVQQQNDLARELFAFVPLDEYAATMSMLNALSDTAQSDLRLLTHRLPPWQREALRVELLAQSETARADWLKQRLSMR